MPFTPLPSLVDNLRFATRIGFTREDAAVHPASRKLTDLNLLVGGRFVITPMLNACTSMPEDNSERGQIKLGAGAGFEKALSALREIDAEVRRINEDARFSEAGRMEARRRLFEVKWLRLNNFTKSLAKNFADLEKWLLRECQPGKLDKTDAAGAMVEAEYRQVVRGMFADQDSPYRPNVRRERFVRLLQRDTADSPVVRAILRAHPLASGFSLDGQQKLALMFALQTSRDAVRSIWSTALALDALAHALYAGTVRASMMCDSNGDPRAREMLKETAECEERESLRVWLNALVTGHDWAILAEEAIEEAKEIDEQAKTDPTKLMTQGAQAIGAERQAIEAEQRRRNSETPSPTMTVHSGGPRGLRGRRPVATRGSRAGAERFG